MQRAIAIPQRHLGRFRWNQDYADIAIALTLATLAIVTMVRDHHRLDLISGPLLLLQTLPIAWRRRNPMRILYVAGTTITLYSLLGYPESNGSLGVFVAFYTVAANESRRRATGASATPASAPPRPRPRP